MCHSVKTSQFWSFYARLGGSPYTNLGGSPYTSLGGSPYTNLGGSSYTSLGGSAFQPPIVRFSLSNEIPTLNSLSLLLVSYGAAASVQRFGSDAAFSAQ